MSQPIPASSSMSTSSLPKFPYTPNSTPPSNTTTTTSSPAFESRLHKLLASFDSGTHSFCREDRDDSAINANDLFGFGLPTPPSSRRPSFLSHLTLSRPPIASLKSQLDSSIPCPSPISGTQRSPSSLLSSSPKSPTEVTSTARPNLSTIHDNGRESVEMGRAASSPQLPYRIEGFPDVKIGGRERRHFDPSREPKLLGLL